MRTFKKGTTGRPLLTIGTMGLSERQQRRVNELRRSLEARLRKRFGVDGVPREWVERIRTACNALARELRNNARLEQSRKGKAKLTVEQQMECEKAAERAAKDREKAVDAIAQATKPDEWLSDYSRLLDGLANGSSRSPSPVPIPKQAEPQAVSTARRDVAEPMRPTGQAERAVEKLKAKAEENPPAAVEQIVETAPVVAPPPPPPPVEQPPSSPATSEPWMGAPIRQGLLKCVDTGKIIDPNTWTPVGLDSRGCMIWVPPKVPSEPPTLAPDGWPAGVPRLPEAARRGREGMR
jgi:hypothetical protein